MYLAYTVAENGKTTLTIVTSVNAYQIGIGNKDDEQRYAYHVHTLVNKDDEKFTVTSSDSEAGITNCGIRNV